MLTGPVRDQPGREMVYSGGVGSGGSAKQTLETDRSKRAEITILVINFMPANPLSF